MPVAPVDLGCDRWGGTARVLASNKRYYWRVATASAGASDTPFLGRSDVLAQRNGSWLSSRREPGTATISGADRGRARLRLAVAAGAHREAGQPHQQAAERRGD